MKLIKSLLVYQAMKIMYQISTLLEDILIEHLLWIIIKEDWSHKGKNSLIEYCECYHIFIKRSRERESLYKSMTTKEYSEDWSHNVMIFWI